MMLSLRRILYITIAILTFAVGCLSKFFWDLNYGERVIACSMEGPQKTPQLVIGIITLFGSMFSLSILSSKIVLICNSDDS